MQWILEVYISRKFLGNFSTSGTVWYYTVDGLTMHNVNALSINYKHNFGYSVALVDLKSLPRVNMKRFANYTTVFPA